jgi:hypothetical protein
MIVYSTMSKAIGNERTSTLVENSVFSMRLVQHREIPCFLMVLLPSCTLNIRFRPVNGYVTKLKILRLPHEDLAFAGDGSVAAVTAIAADAGLMGDREAQSVQTPGIQV